MLHGDASPTGEELITKTRTLQMPFIANNGQVDEQVRFYAKTFGGTVFVTKEGEIVYALPEYRGGRDVPAGASQEAGRGLKHGGSGAEGQGSRDACRDALRASLYFGWHGQAPLVHADAECVAANTGAARTGTQMIIAEPSPDAIQNVASRLNATLSGKTKAQIPEAQATLLREEIRQAARMTIRSQGTQYLRDTSYRLAEARLNNNITDEQYLKRFDTILRTTARLIKTELKGNPLLSTPPADIEIKLPGAQENGTGTSGVPPKS